MGNKYPHKRHPWATMKVDQWFRLEYLDNGKLVKAANIKYAPKRFKASLVSVSDDDDRFYKIRRHHTYIRRIA